MNQELEEKKKRIIAKQNEIDERIKKIWPIGAGLDGIACIDNYLENSDSKILWVLKEAGKPSNIDFKTAYDYRERFMYAADNNKWRISWGNVASISLGIHLYCNDNQNSQLFTAEKLPDITVDGSEPYSTGHYPLSEIAIINIKKQSSLNATSKQQVINQEYERKGVKELLLDQVNYINPDIIIMGCKVPLFAEDISGIKLNDFYESSVKDTNNRPISLFQDDGKKLFIYTHHPCLMGLAKGTKKEDYINSIFYAVKTIYGY